MKKRWPALLVRVMVSGLSLLVLAVLLGRLSPVPSVWIRGPAAFALVKVVGDIVVLALFRQAVVLFVEDLFWELVAFVVLGFLAAGLIALTAGLIGGPVQPYFPALVVYFVYLVAESRQAGRAERE